VKRSRPGARRPRVGTLAIASLAAWLAAAPSASSGALPASVEVSGFVRESPILWRQAPLFEGARDLSVNLIHTRQRVRWYAAPAVTVGLDLRERLFSGSDAGVLAGLIVPPAQRPPYFDWTAVADRTQAYADATIDRLWIDAAAGPVEIRCGRQRVAWGTNLVWNPIDLFNPSSWLDFENEEKPGADALRLQYYAGPASELDVAWAPGRDPTDTGAAVRAKVNRWGYDWMLVSGRKAGDEVAGFGWAGSVAGGGFSGEFLAGRPRKGPARTGRAYVNASVSGDYAFPNTTYLQISTLFESRGSMGDAGGENLLEAVRRGDLSPGRWSLFGEIARDLTPLWRADLSAIVNPSDRSYYVGPSLKWSAAPDLDLTAQALLFGGGPGTEFGDEGRIWTAMARYSF
jgi:hypothetical protein